MPLNNLIKMELSELIISENPKPKPSLFIKVEIYVVVQSYSWYTHTLYQRKENMPNCTTGNIDQKHLHFLCHLHLINQTSDILSSYNFHHLSPCNFTTS